MIEDSLTEAADKAGTASFEDLLSRYQRLVLRTAWRLLGQIEDAQDAAQDVFLRLHRHLGRMDANLGIESWLYRTTVNVCYDQLRARRASAPIDRLPEEPAVGAVQLMTLERDERGRLLHEALGRLTDKERAAVVLREIEGLETSEVASILGSTEATVRSHVSNGKAHMKAWLARRMR